MKIKNFIYVLLASYLGIFLRSYIGNNFIISIIGSFFLGFVIAKRLSISKEEIMLSGFFASFTSFSGFIYFLYEILSKGDFIRFIFYLNFIIILNIFTMYFGFWMSRKIS